MKTAAFKLKYTSTRTWAPNSFTSAKDAVNFGKQKGVPFEVWKKDRQVASWTEHGLYYW